MLKRALCISGHHLVQVVGTACRRHDATLLGEGIGGSNRPFRMYTFMLDC